MKLQKLLLLFSIISSFTLFGQERIPGTNYTHFQLKNKKDTIDFVVADTSFNEVKPILLFCQGSQPLPLFIVFDDGYILSAPLGNFDLQYMKLNYYVVVISMPHTPIIVSTSHLNKEYCYIKDTTNQHSYSLDYLRADHAENYINRANIVLKYLKKQKWVNPNELVVAGHSQGSRIAVGIAASNKKVTRLGLFGYNPMNRVEQLIRQARKSAEKGEITWEKADSLQQEQLEFYKMIQNEDSVKAHPYLTAWKSFSKSTLDELLQIDIPIYVAYGSEDIAADLCDLIPLKFIENGKDNLTLHRYPNLDHNFFPVKENGESDHSTRGFWQEVMNAFIDWTRK
ncbi:MAG: dienelactone hydrolase family protein [Crocinitomicaceae bacterium]